MARALNAIARDIRTAWAKPYFGAVPYIQAMGEIDSIEQDYGYDPARQIVAYFLANAGTFRGPQAKALKAELKALLNGRGQ